MKTDKKISINIEQAKEMVDAFSEICNLPCELIDSDGKSLYKASSHDMIRSKCHRYIHEPWDCEHLQQYSIEQSERFGGRYIYSCPAGMGWITVPIYSEGKTEAALSVGPILMTEVVDYLAGMEDVDQHDFIMIVETLKEFPVCNPSELNDISKMILAIAIYLSDSSRVLMENSVRDKVERELGENILQLRKKHSIVNYPKEREDALLRAIRNRNYVEARHILNELFAYILLSSENDLVSIRTRSIELIVMISRAVGEENVDFSELLALNEKYMTSIINISSIEDLHMWLVGVIDQYINIIFDSKEVKHQDTILKAIRYMKDNLARRVTLDEVAAYVGFSPTYFSKIFSEEFEETFSTYLTRLRIERSMELLILEKMSVGEISAMVGFEDQSYFTNVFKKFTGVTPAKYRKKQGKIDSMKEKNL